MVKDKLRDYLDPSINDLVTSLSQEQNQQLDQQLLSIDVQLMSNTHPDYNREDTVANLLLGNLQFNLKPMIINKIIHFVSSPPEAKEN